MLKMKTKRGKESTGETLSSKKKKKRKRKRRRKPRTRLQKK